ncbi:16109_t:CDS:2 [Racocetra fulgida]|uniref:16109_t:CDS:1 n=1 Tax=Racocetra fulgida TaxID=60492 RepID=A0A9N9BBD4_9GLOM|nr:16109_t:CDS:2 [Racocetra fulgida]
MSKKEGRKIVKDLDERFKEQEFKIESNNLSKALTYKRKEKHQEAWEIIQNLLTCKQPIIQSQAEYLAAEYYLNGYVKKDENKAFGFAKKLADKEEYMKALNIFNQISKRENSKFKDKALDMIHKYKGMESDVFQNIEHNNGISVFIPQGYSPILIHEDATKKLKTQGIPRSKSTCSSIDLSSH